MPEIMVRIISGHAANNKEFYRYVNYAQKTYNILGEEIYSSEISSVITKIPPFNFSGGVKLLVLSNSERILSTYKFE